MLSYDASEASPLRVTDMPKKFQETTYTPLFCEENIWFLSQQLLEKGILDKQMFVLFLSNPSRSIVLFQQRKAKLGHFVIWDYHVVLQARQNNIDWIYDFDSRLPFPTPLSRYFSKTFPNHQDLPETYRTMIRRVPAVEYLKYFFSDRSHMTGKIAPDEFPKYSIITPDASRQPIALFDYLDMHKQLNDHSLVFEFEDYPTSTQS